MRPSLLAALATLVLSVPPALAGPTTTPRRVASDRIDFVAWDDVDLSRRDMARSERFLAETERRLGATVQGRVEYHRVTLVSQVAALAGLYGTGATVCGAGGGRIYSTRTYHPHELVHRVACELGDPGRFFSEGLAVALADEEGWTGRPLRLRAQQALRRAPFEAYRLRFESLPAEDAYAVAGAFVRHLVDRHGTAPLAALHRACRPGTDVARAYAGVFGRSLEADAREWVAGLGVS